MICALVAVLFVVVGTLGFVWPRRDAKAFDRASPDDLMLKQEAAALMGCAVELDDVLDERRRGEA